VLVQPTLHAEGYPDLSEVLGKIGRDCVADGIGVRQLRRIAFFEQEVNLEWITAAGKREVHNYPIGPTLH
jgi:hypothetical protein